ncbi:MAG: nuclear transport factor 2 family protein [Trebonia sp.]
MKQEEAVAFAEQWVKDWNAHDVEAVLAHFADDAVFTSPLAERLFPESGGVISGKDALRRYWSEGIRSGPGLRFELLDVYAGVGTIVIRFRNERGTDRCEVLTFDGGLVATGHGADLATSGQTARAGGRGSRTRSELACF